MKTITEITSHTEKLQLGYWDMIQEIFIPIDPSSASDVEQAMEALSCSLALIDALGVLIDNIKCCVHADLVDIWERLDHADL